MSTLSVNNVTEVGGAPVVTNGVLDSGSLPTGTVLQVVSTTKTDTFSTSSTSFVDVTGLSTTITPSSTNSKILISGMVSFALQNANTNCEYRIDRDGTSVAIGDPTGNRPGATGHWYAADANGNYGTGQMAFSYLDSPNSASAVTYTVELRTSSGSTVKLNASESDGDNSNVGRTCSTITAMEVAG